MGWRFLFFVFFVWPKIGAKKRRKSVRFFFFVIFGSGLKWGPKIAATANFYNRGKKEKNDYIKKKEKRGEKKGGVYTVGVWVCMSKNRKRV